ncbi:hypothetical protein IQ07DRAFT_495575 [Pyrenochaeta sp. DS3sAY3a]|nr:hypothetical protein IQ07DRAFT_495575 [Pyrenochaeta sp. DS3sAY3a]
MSWTFHLQNINRSFERIAAWYTEFMHRTELCFRSLHQRVVYLEERQAWRGPTDEQVERVLRKILAEKFSDAGPQMQENIHAMKEEDYFVEHPKGLAMLRSITIDPASLLVEPDAVPSKAYAETFQMLENRLQTYPAHEGLNDPPQEDTENLKMNMEVKPQRRSNDV